MAKPRSLITRLLDTPHLAAIVPHLEPEVLHRVIQQCGLAEAAPFVALATAEQLTHVFDLDLWRSRRAGADEEFDAERFGEWIAVLLEAGDAVAAEKLRGLDLRLIGAGLTQHVRVFDAAAVSSYTTLAGEQVAGRAFDRAPVVEIGGYVIESKGTSVWDTIVALVASIDAADQDGFQRLMRACVRLSDGAREEDASHDLLDDREQNLFDVASDRESRREQKGYVAAAQARAFLRSARELQLDGDPPRPSGFTGAYFRDLAEPRPREGGASVDAAAVFEILRDEGVTLTSPRALLPGGSGTPVHRLPHVEAYLASHPESVGELAYLVNAIAAGASIQGRAFTPEEASTAAAATCNLGLENWPSHWDDRDLVTAFQIGWTTLHREVCLHAAQRVISAVDEIRCGDADIQLGLIALRRELARHLANGEPWRACERLDVLLALDAPAWAALLGLIAECPVMHAAVRPTRRLVRIASDDFEFFSENAQRAAVRGYLASLPSILVGA